ncbi:MAG: HAD-IA family hydrolase, partial [Candidatus Sumerlaeaceae bacterium]|nr:HAD-IA family hydrolase [Candidatus Sumerlaeaceae bacterium]
MPNPNPLIGIKLAVFDLDGTLVDAFGDITNAVNHLLAHEGLQPLTVEQVKPLVGEGAGMLVARALGTTDMSLAAAKMPILIEYYRRNPTQEAKPYDGALEMLRALRQRGIRTAMVTNKPQPLTDHIMKVLGLAPEMDWIIGESDRIPRKPAPEAMRYLMGEVGARPEEVVMVGDSHVDVEFA